MKLIRLLAVAFVLPLLAFSAEPLNVSFKSHFKGLPAAKQSNDLYVNSAPALRLDGADKPKEHNFVGHHFYIFKKSAQALRDKKMRLTMKFYRVSGSAPLTVDYRIFDKANHLLSNKTVAFPLKEKGKWVDFSMDFTVPPLDGIENFNVGCDFLQDGKENNLVIVDEICATEVTESGMVNPPEASVGTAALSKNGSPLVLVKDGKPQFSIVLGANASAVAKAAAKEIQLHVKLATGAEPPIVDDEGIATPAVFVGDNAVTRQYGVNPQVLPLENWVVARVGNAILVSGGERSDIRPDQIFGRETLPLGTLDAAYEFLERVFKVRWYWPGKLGTVVPQTVNLSVEQLYEMGAPAYKCRSLFYDISKDPDIPPRDVVTWQRRNRLGGSFPDPIGMHAFHHWPEAYKDHPDYFALQPNGTRKVNRQSGTHLCLTNPEVIQLAAKETIAYFQKKPNARFCNVMPGDCNDLYFCRCPRCQETVTADKGRPGIHSNAVWGFVNQVAAIVAQSCPGKYIKCCAYADYQRRPDFPLMPNVAVTLCYGPTPRGDLDYKLNWRKLVDEWRSTGAALYVWEYWLPRYSRGVFGAPSFFPRQLKEIFLLDSTQVSGRVIELCDKNSQGNSVVGWGDWMYDVLNLFMSMRLMWNPQMDVEQELALFYQTFYGPAASTMKAFYDSMELAWSRSLWQENDSAVWDWEVCWKNVYPPKFVDEMMGLLRKAVVQTEGQEPYASRTKKTLTGLLPFEENSKLFRGGANAPKTNTLDVPKAVAAPVIDGEVTEAEWKGAARTTPFVDSYNVYAVKSTTDFSLQYDDQNLYVAIVAKYPEADDRLLWYPAASGRRDGFLWEFESAEFFLAGKGRDYFQFIVAPDNALYDSYYSGKERDDTGDVKWNAKVTCATRRFKGGWSAELAIPIAEITTKTPLDTRGFRANFARNHRYFNQQNSRIWEQSMWLPSYGSFDNLDKFGTIYLKNEAVK